MVLAWIHWVNFSFILNQSIKNYGWIDFLNTTSDEAFCQDSKVISNWFGVPIIAMYIPTNCDGTLLASQASSGRRPTSLLSLPFSFMCVRHGPCLLTEEKKIHTLEVKCVRKLLRMLSLENKISDWVWSKINFLVAHRNLFWQLSRDGNWHGLDISRTTTAFLHPSWHLGGRATQQSADEMMDGQHQRVDIPGYARTAHEDLPYKRLEEGLSWIVRLVFSTTRFVEGLNWTELQTHFVFASTLRQLTNHSVCAC